MLHGARASPNLFTHKDTFLKPNHVASSLKENLMTELQNSAIKDVERRFGELQGRALIGTFKRQ